MKFKGAIPSLVVVLSLTACTGLAITQARGENRLDARGKGLIFSRCVGCHTRDVEGRIGRISYQRKTPEGWYMTITRMQHDHGLVVSERDKDAIVKYLADTQGLAPTEVAAYRYALEHRNNYIEKYNAVNRPDPYGIAVQCTRCHSYARIALQRRTNEEWRLLLNFHLAQYPSIEYQPVALTYPWWRTVKATLPKILTQQFPLDTNEWTTWRSHPDPNLSGIWEVTGHMPGVGFYHGRRTITRVASDRPDSYRTSERLWFADGEQDSTDGTAILYTKYHWLGDTSLRREKVDEAFWVSEDGNEISGRWYFDQHPELGADYHATRVLPGTARVLAIEPASIRAGAQVKVTLYGIHLLSGAPEFGPGVSATVLSRTDDRVVVDISAAKNAAIGPRPVTLGTAPSMATLAVYKRVEHVEIKPGYAFSRLGGGGGRVSAVEAQFEVVAYAVMPESGKAFPVGEVAAKWSLAPHTKLAKEWNDALYAGHITATGLFLPGESGINPLRTVGTMNNSGDLTVKAVVVADGRTLVGTAHLVVSTAPLYFNAPIP